MVRMVRTRVLLLVAAALVFLWCWGDVAVPALCWLTNGQLCPEGVRKASSPYNRQLETWPFHSYLQGPEQRESEPTSRDVLWCEPWPEKQMDDTHPELSTVYSTVHYLWCGKKTFQFHDYLGVLSALRVLQPTKVVFHYTYLPKTDDYNSWFLELAKSVPGLELQQIPSMDCESGSALMNTTFKFLSAQGGVYIGQSLILSRPPPSTNDSFVFSVSTKTSFSSAARGIIFASQGFNESTKQEYVRDILLSPASSKCVSIDSYNEKMANEDESSWCIDVNETNPLHPRDILHADTPFAELARWLFYGRRSPLVARPAIDSLIPRVSHYIWMESGEGSLFEGPQGFSRFLSVLSSLYVAGFERVYLHVERTPRGYWWDALAGENVTLVHVQRPRSVYQSRISVVEHASDVARYLVLYKYGGAYQDVDVVWTQRVPDWLLAYPTVVAMDWAMRGHFPDTFNLGVLLSRPHAPWLRHFLESHRDFRDRDWAYNSLQMSYRTYELYPDTVYLDRHLQVLCYRGICHPPWEPGFVRSEFDTRATIPFQWQTETRSIHMILPEPFASFASPMSLRNGSDLFAEVGRFILEKSGRTHLLA